VVRINSPEGPHSAPFRPVFERCEKNVPTGETGGASGIRTLGARALRLRSGNRFKPTGSGRIVTPGCTADGTEVTAAEDKKPDPLPLPRSLRDHRAIRREMTALYRQGKAGRIDPALLGRLVHLLNVLAGIIRDVEFEERLVRLEDAASSDPDWLGPTSNGAKHHASRH